MIYEKPALRALGSFTELTLGMNGSCPDGGGLNNQSLGGMGVCSMSGGMGMP